MGLDGVLAAMNLTRYYAEPTSWPPYYITYEPIRILPDDREAWYVNIMRRDGDSAAVWVCDADLDMAREQAMSWVKHHAEHTPPDELLPQGCGE